MNAKKAKKLRKVVKAFSKDKPKVAYTHLDHYVKITTGELNEDGTRKIVTVRREQRILTIECQRSMYQTLKSLQ